MTLNNKYYILRHGEAVSNARDIVSCWPEKFENPLTKKGMAQIEKVAKELKDKNIHLIFFSPLLRTKQTAEIIARSLGVKIRLDKRIKEISFGIFNSKPAKEFHSYFKKDASRIKKKPPKGENYTELSKRMREFLKSVDKKYNGKNILIVSHQAPLSLLWGNVSGYSISKTTKMITDIFGKEGIEKGELVKLN